MKYNFIQRILSYYYRKAGRKIAKNSLFFLIIPIIVSIILSMGIIFVKVERNVDYLYPIRNGEASRKKRIVEELFPMNFSTECDPLRITDRNYLLYLLIFPHDGGDMLRKEYLREIATIDNFVRTFQVKHNNVIYNYSKICAMKEGECYLNPILQYKAGDKIKYPVEVDPLTYVFVPYVVNLGGVVADDDSNVIMAAALRLMYILNNGMTDDEPLIKEWQNAFLRHMLSWQSDLVTVQAFVPTAIEDELSQFTYHLIPFVGIAVVSILTFSMVTSATNSWIRSKPWLGVAACFSAALALGASFGVVIVCGASYVDINIALPFLILGMGVDDAYVLIAAWRRTKAEWSVERRMEETYSEAAVSISITSLTNILSFCVGMLTPIPAMQLFCIYAAAGVAFTFLYLMLFFGACLSISGYREKSEIHPLTCKAIVRRKKPSLRDNSSGDYIMTLFRDKLGTLFTFRAFKMVVIIAYGVILGTGIWGLQHLSAATEINDAFSSDSFLYASMNSHYKYFTQYPYTLHIVINETLNYADPLVQTQLDDLFLRLQSSPQVGDERTLLSWLKYYKSFQKNPFGKFLLRGYNMSNKQEFIDGLCNVFLNIRLAEQFKQDIVFNSNYTEIVASRFVLLLKDLNTVALEQKVYKYIKEVAATSKIPIVAHSMLFPIFEQTGGILSVIIQLGWVTTLLLTIIFFLFIPNIKCVICVSIAVVSSMVETIGLMALWNVKLDVVSMIMLTLSAGFSINYPTHVSVSFMMDKSACTNGRMKQCLYSVGMPIVQGTLSTLIAVAPLLYKRVYVLDSCFKIIFLIATTTAFHALFVIPVVLSILEVSFHRKLSQKLDDDGSLEEKEECLVNSESISRTDSFFLDRHNSDAVHFFKK